MSDHVSRKIPGGQVPIWFLAVIALTVAAGIGVGTMLGDGISGDVPTVIEQGLAVSQPTVVAAGDGFSNDQSFTSVNDKGTRFTAAVEIDAGDKYKVQVPLSNQTGQSMVVEMSMSIPLGITVDVDGDGSDNSDSTGVGNVTRTDLSTWKFDLANTTSTNDNLEIEVAHADDAPVGFYKIQAELVQVTN